MGRVRDHDLKWAMPGMWSKAEWRAECGVKVTVRLCLARALTSYLEAGGNSFSEAVLDLREKIR